MPTFQENDGLFSQRQDFLFLEWSGGCTGTPKGAEQRKERISHATPWF